MGNSAVLNSALVDPHHNRHLAPILDPLGGELDVVTLILGNPHEIERRGAAPFDDWTLELEVHLAHEASIAHVRSWNSTSLLPALFPHKHSLRFALEIDVGLAADINGDPMDRTAGETVRALPGIVLGHRISDIAADG